MLIACSDCKKIHGALDECEFDDLRELKEVKRNKKKSLKAANKIADSFEFGFFDTEMIKQVAAIIEKVYAKKKENKNVS